MPRYDVVVESPVADSFRVQQVIGMFDVPLSDKVGESFSVEVPGEDEDWQIGAIVGPSGSGKTTIAREVYGSSMFSRPRWPKGKAVIDGFPESMSAKEVTSILTSVGFSSPPSWIKPYQVLSNGEQFRCDLARVLLSEKPLIAFDEFTSVVDRTVAQIGSAAIARTIRKGRVKKKFVAVTCHYDILDWLECDWVLDMASGALARGRLRRPEIKLSIRRGNSKGWPYFARHHYLSGSLAPAARCYYAFWGSRLVGFCAFLGTIGKKSWRRVTRLVVLPDFQGIGVGGALLDACCQLIRKEGSRAAITTSHPAMIGYLKASKMWKITDVKKTGAPKVGFRSTSGATYKASTGRAVVSAYFMGEANV